MSQSAQSTTKATHRIIHVSRVSLLRLMSQDYSKGDAKFGYLRAVVAELWPSRKDYLYRHLPLGMDTWIAGLAPVDAGDRIPSTPSRFAQKIDASGSSNTRLGILMTEEAFQYAAWNVYRLSEERGDLDCLLTVGINPVFTIYACIAHKIDLPRNISRELLWTILHKLVQANHVNALVDSQTAVPKTAADIGDRQDPEHIVQRVVALRAGASAGLPAGEYAVHLLWGADGIRGRCGSDTFWRSHVRVKGVTEGEWAVLHAFLIWIASLRGLRTLRFVMDDPSLVHLINQSNSFSAESPLEIVAIYCNRHGIKLRAMWSPSPAISAIIFGAPLPSYTEIHGSRYSQNMVMQAQLHWKSSASRRVPPVIQAVSNLLATWDRTSTRPRSLSVAEGVRLQGIQPRARPDKSGDTRMTAHAQSSRSAAYAPLVESRRPSTGARLPARTHVQQGPSAFPRHPPPARSQHVVLDYPAPVIAQRGSNILRSYSSYGMI